MSKKMKKVILNKKSQIVQNLPRTQTPKLIQKVEPPKVKHDSKALLTEAYSGPVYTVTTTVDSGAGSLAAAITAINTAASSTTSNIIFNIPTSFATVIAGVNYYIIQPGLTTSGVPLPTISYPVRLNGKNSDGGFVKLDGTYALTTTVPDAGVPVALALVNATASKSRIKYVTFSVFAIDIFLENLFDVKICGCTFSADVTNNNSVTGLNVTDIKVGSSSFTSTTNDAGGIFLTNPGGNFKVKKCTFDTFTATSTFSGGNGVYVLLDNGATLDSVCVSNSNFSNISNPYNGLGGNGILVDFESDGGVLNEYRVKNSTFQNQTTDSSGIVAYLNTTTSTLTNFKVVGSTFNNITDVSSGIYYSSLGTSTNIIVTHSNFTNLIGGSDAPTIGLNIMMYGDSQTVSNVIVSDSYFNNFDANTSGYGSAIIYSAYTTTSSILTNFTVKNCNFNGITNGDIGVYPYLNPANGTAVISNLIVSGNIFNNVSNGSNAINAGFGAGGSITDFNIMNNTFTNVADTSDAISLSTAGVGTFSTLEVTNNRFSGSTATTNGFATNLLVDNGTTCLTFTNNTASPISSPDPYLLVQSGVGVLNTSSVVGNIGTVDTSGTIGSC